MGNCTERIDSTGRRLFISVADGSDVIADPDMGMRVVRLGRPDSGTGHEGRLGPRRRDTDRVQ